MFVARDHVVELRGADGQHLTFGRLNGNRDSKQLSDLTRPRARGNHHRPGFNPLVANADSVDVPSCPADLGRRHASSQLCATFFSRQRPGGGQLAVMQMVIVRKMDGSAQVRGQGRFSLPERLG